ncbi:hypothetical protein [Streptomyces sp. NPDC048419]|uniref:hypothetical protein n=1 Tax=Streptomyces sp. NPDC048419 TaxID=3365547 RepID=UPI00371289CB
MPRTEESGSQAAYLAARLRAVPSFEIPAERRVGGDGVRLVRLRDGPLNRGDFTRSFG